ncbi:hypothetical protein CSKR_103816 [Clonorchis sinensis]|uniref:Uncharacterized protein n=1 Tax=Clonorchis sinensis TaxID=79923 RepID=A0A3R7FRJ5_CLOSI|nr:hypothetical protein CSKR_103816 [Clonorchis sinensis]
MKNHYENGVYRGFLSTADESQQRIIIDSMTSVFKNDASLSQNYDLLQSLIGNVSNKTEWRSHGPHPGKQVRPTPPKRFGISFIPFGKQWFGMHNKWPNQHSFWS